jgi:hypothetical protein
MEDFFIGKILAKQDADDRPMSPLNLTKNKLLPQP